jgi:hypothetical protein
MVWLWKEGTSIKFQIQDLTLFFRGQIVLRALACKSQCDHGTMLHTNKFKIQDLALFPALVLGMLL